jgi:hypothetical protein
MHIVLLYAAKEAPNVYKNPPLLRIQSFVFSITNPHQLKEKRGLRSPQQKCHIQRAPALDDHSFHRASTSCGLPGPLRSDSITIYIIFCGSGTAE